MCPVEQVQQVPTLGHDEVKMYVMRAGPYRSAKQHAQTFAKSTRKSDRLVGMHGFVVDEL